ncbi:MAG: amino acid ABC transporter permease [Verrucomicrobia bacterium]|nr:amino acid ABC transporter permease [Verrucomicrobiota bacterium]
MNSYSWQWSVLNDYWPAFRNGAVVTVLLTAVIVVVGSLLGIAFGVLLADKSRALAPARWLVWIVVETLRALPVLVVLVYFHYVLTGSSAWLHKLLTMLAGAVQPEPGTMSDAILKTVASRPFATSVVALSLNLSAFVADIIRNGILGVPKPLIDAAKSLGMGPWLRLRRVILPEALRTSLAGLVAMFITMFKFTTLAAFIGCNELMNVVYTAGNSSYRYLELFTMLAFAYLVILMPATFAARRVEQSRWLQRRS